MSRVFIPGFKDSTVAKSYLEDNYLKDDVIYGLLALKVSSSGSSSISVTDSMTIGDATGDAVLTLSKGADSNTESTIDFARSGSGTTFQIGELEGSPASLDFVNASDVGFHLESDGSLTVDNSIDFVNASGSVLNFNNATEDQFNITHTASDSLRIQTNASFGFEMNNGGTVNFERGIGFINASGSTINFNNATDDQFNIEHTSDDKLRIQTNASNGIEMNNSGAVTFEQNATFTNDIIANGDVDFSNASSVTYGGDGYGAQYTVLKKGDGTAYDYVETFSSDDTPKFHMGFDSNNFRLSFDANSGGYSSSKQTKGFYLDTGGTFWKTDNTSDNSINMNSINASGNNINLMNNGTTEFQLEHTAGDNLRIGPNSGGGLFFESSGTLQMGGDDGSGLGSSLIMQADGTGNDNLITFQSDNVNKYRLSHDTGANTMWMKFHEGSGVYTYGWELDSGGNLDVTSLTTDSFDASTGTTLSIGSATANAIELGATDCNVTTLGNLTVDGDMTVNDIDGTNNATLTIGAASAAIIEMGASDCNTNIKGNAVIDGTCRTTDVDTGSGVTLSIGGTYASALHLGASDCETTALGDMTVNGDMTIDGNLDVAYPGGKTISVLDTGETLTYTNDALAGSFYLKAGFLHTGSANIYGLGGGADSVTIVNTTSKNKEELFWADPVANGFRIRYYHDDGSTNLPVNTQVYWIRMPVSGTQGGTIT